MTFKKLSLLATLGLVFASAYFTFNLAAQAPAARPKLYNTAKQKLLEGKQLVGVTIFSPDPNIYCAAANSVTTSPGSRCSIVR